MHDRAHAHRLSTPQRCLAPRATLGPLAASDVHKYEYTPLQDNVEIAALWAFQRCGGGRGERGERERRVV